MSVVYDVPPLYHHSSPEHRRLLALGAQRLFDGKVNSTGTVTLTANQATTTLNDVRISANSIILFMPTTANAGGEVGMYISARSNGQATITHGNSALSDRTFGYVVLG